jgi:hypothetical protein
MVTPEDKEDEAYISALHGREDPAFDEDDFLVPDDLFDGVDEDLGFTPAPGFANRQDDESKSFPSAEETLA